MKQRKLGANHPLAMVAPGYLGIAFNSRRHDVLVALLEAAYQAGVRTVTDEVDNQMLELKAWSGDWIAGMRVAQDILERDDD